MIDSGKKIEHSKAVSFSGETPIHWDYREMDKYFTHLGLELTLIDSLKSNFFEGLGTQLDLVGTPIWYKIGKLEFDDESF